MLKKLSIIWALVGFLALSPSIPTVEAQSNVLDQIIVTVDGSPITETEIQRRINWLTFLANNAGQSNFSAEIARRQAIDDAIVARLFRKRARAINLRLTEDEVSARIASVIELNNVPAEQFFAELASVGISQEEFQQTVIEILLSEKLTEQLVIPRINIREEEIDRYLAANSEEFLPVNEYDLSLIVVGETLSMNFEQKQLLRQLVRNIEFELQQGNDFFQVATAASRFEGVQAGNLGWVQSVELDPELARELSPEKINQVVGPVVSGVNTYFALINQHRTGPEPEFPPLQELHLARIVLQATNEAGADANLELLEELRNSIIGGADFGEIAKVYSHDTSTRKQGGDLGWIPEDSLPFEFLAPLSQMNIGDVSPVQRIGNIVYILNFRGIRDASVEQKKRSVVRNRLRNFRLRNERANWIDELRENSVIDFRATF